MLSHSGAVEPLVPGYAARVRSVIQAALDARVGNLERLRADDGALAAIERAAALLTGAFSSEGRVWACGNGGSMADAMHFAEELAGSFREERAPLPASALSDPAYLTCVANDFGFERVFERAVIGHVRSGDVLVALSTSGSSENVVRAAAAARAQGASVVALTGRSASPLAAHADVELCCEAGRWSDAAQELHMTILHLLVELVEHDLFEAGSDDGTVARGPAQAG